MSIVRLRIIGECVLQVGDRCIEPDAPRLFALLLYLCHAEGRAIHKTELFELLFPEVTVNKQASHNLRQLLYRLRGMGAPVHTQGERIRLSGDFITSSLDDLASHSRQERLRVKASSLVVLPSYEPRISRQFGDWVETIRSQTASRVRRILREDFRAHKRECQWEGVVSSWRTLQLLGDSSEELVSGNAEALLMLGRKHEALDELDAYLLECETSSVPALRQLRARIARSKNDHKLAIESSFHGRNEVMLALSRQWTAAAMNESQVAVVVGQPGIGKSRLLREFGLYATLHRGQCLSYRCDNMDLARPHSLFRHVLPQLRALRGSLGASPDLQPQLDRLCHNDASLTPIELPSLEATKSELQLALIDLVEAVASESPLVLTIDDAHHLDSASHMVIDALCTQSRSIALMVVASYRGAEGEGFSIGGQYASVHHLDALGSADSLAVLQDLLPQRRTDHSYLTLCAARANGNPYFLHAIAHSDTMGAVPDSIPFDIRAFASAAYYRLTTDSRTLFETCLLLGRFANLRRVRDITAIDGPPLLAALRSLEGNGLLRFSGGELRCTHALLEDACRALIPSAIAAVLHERIAKCLGNECTSQGYSAPLAWAAAESWIAAGDIHAAGRLLQQCAAQAAALGEPLLAARTLRHVPLSGLSPRERIDLLRAIADYEEAAAERDQVCATLRELLSASRELPCTREALQEIEFRIVEADLRLGTEPNDCIAPLTALLTDDDAPAPLRIRSGIRLLIAADMNLDASLAELTLTQLRPVLLSLPPEEPLRLRAELIYETVFGDQQRACDLATQLLSSQATPALAQTAVNARRNAAFALSRMGFRNRAYPVLLADYRFMSAHHVASEAAYSLLLLADIALCDGDVAAASNWLREATPLVTTSPLIHSVQAGYYSAAASVALLEGRTADAENLIVNARGRYPAIGLRYRALDLSLRLRVKAARGCNARSDPDLDELRRLYELGASLGGQDPIVEALWLAGEQGRSGMLSEYLLGRRRELTAPEVSLRQTTERDRAWQLFIKPTTVS